jgi:hypothetical protein
VNSSGVYIYKSVVNDLRHGNFICKSEVVYLYRLSVPLENVYSNHHLSDVTKVFIDRLEIQMFCVLELLQTRDYELEYCFKILRSWGSDEDVRVSLNPVEFTYVNR